MKSRLILYSVLSIATTIAIISFFWDISRPNDTDNSETLKAYGTKYNPTRSANSIPLVEANWNALELDTGHIYWSHPQRDVDRKEPFHLFKISYLSSNRLTSEEDAIHFESEGDTAYRVMVTNYMNGGNRPDSTRYDLILYFKGSYPPSRIERISKQQSDSILGKWNTIRE